MNFEIKPDEMPAHNQSLGRMMVGGGPRERRENDFYPTEPEAAIVLCDYLAPIIQESGHGIWECACGDGALSEVMKEYGFSVVSTDLIDRGYGAVQDFLSTKGLLADVVVTNPLFNMAEEFIRHALGLGASRVYMLLKSTFFHADCRSDLFDKYPPTRIMPFTWRLDFTGEGKPTMECIWVEWIAGHKGDTIYGPLLRKPNKDRCRHTIDMFDENF